MKRIIFFILLLSLITNLNAQKGNHDKIKAYKTAFITNKLDLSSIEAQQFWPVYNTFSKQEKKLRVTDLKAIRKRVQQAGGIDVFTDKEANRILNEVITIEENLHQLKKDLINDLKPIISTKKILKLLRAEKEFNRKLLNQIKERRMKRKS